MGNDKMCDILETVGCRAKQTKIWTSRVSIHCTYIQSVQGQFGLNRCVSDFCGPCTCTCCISKTANRRAKRTKIWASGVSM